MTTEREPTRRWLGTLAVAAAAVVFVFPLALDWPLLDPDEGLHAAIAQEMLHRGEWMTPTFLGRPFFDKPILYFWAQMLSLRFFGESEAAVRLPGLMFGLLGAATTGLLAGRLFVGCSEEVKWIERSEPHQPKPDANPVELCSARPTLRASSVGLLSFVLYTTTILPAALAQSAAHDVALVPWVNLAILLLLESEKKGKRLCLLGAGLMLGLSILTKGFLGMAVVGLAYGGYCLIRILGRKDKGGSPIFAPNPPQNTSPILLGEAPGARTGDKMQNAGLFHRISLRLNPLPKGEGIVSAAKNETPALFARLALRGCLVLAVAAATAAPWYAAVERQHPGFLRYYILERHVFGFAAEGQPHSNQPWWYYLPILVGGGLPWIGYIGLARRKWLNGSREGIEAGGQSFLHGTPGTECLSSCSLLWFWALGWTAFLTVARSKLATYLWPAFPPIAMLAAVAWARLFMDPPNSDVDRDSRFIREIRPPVGRPLTVAFPRHNSGALSDAARKKFSRTFVSSSLSGPVVLPAVFLAVQWIFGIGYGWTAWAAVGAAAAISPLPALFWRAGKLRAAFAGAVLSVAVQFVAAMTFVLPPVAEDHSARMLAEHFNRQGRLPEKLWIADERIGSLAFYLEPRLREEIAEGRVEYLSPIAPTSPQPNDTVVVRDRRLKRVGRFLELEGLPYESVGSFRLYRGVQRKPEIGVRD